MQAFLFTGSPSNTGLWKQQTAWNQRDSSSSVFSARPAVPPKIHCKSIMTPAIDIRYALLLTGKEDSSLDRSMLREAGVRRLHILKSGLSAARFLARQSSSGERPSIVLCSEDIADISCTEFAALMRLHPIYNTLPILFLTKQESTISHPQNAITDERIGIMVRPYSSAALKNVLFALINAPVMFHSEAGNSDTAFRKEFSRLEARCKRKPITAQDNFNEGVHSLRQRQWDNALRYFQLATQTVSLRGDAQLGMAAAWKGKGNEQKYREYMAYAAESFALAEKWARAHTVFVRLLRDDPNAVSPFLAAIEKLVKEGRFEDAARALAEGHDVTPEAELNKMLAMTFLSSDTPEQQAAAWQHALAGTDLAHASTDMGLTVRKAMKDRTQLMRQRREERNRNAAREAAADAAFQRRRERLGAISLVDEGVSSQTSKTKLLSFGTLLPDNITDTEAAQQNELNNALFSDTQEVHSDNTAKTPVPDRQSLSAVQGESSLFRSIPAVNEIMSVIKTTWQIAKRL